VGSSWHVRMLVVAASLIAGAAAAAAEYSESEVKAAFLFHFSTYVEWPNASETDAPIIIAVLEAPEIAENLERFVQGRSIQARPVRVRTLTTLDAFPGGEVLYIGIQSPRRVARLISMVDTPTLIVTDVPLGLPDGAMINFRLVDRRVRFEISLPEAQRAGLLLSSRLLAAALQVSTTRCYELCTARPMPAYGFPVGR
jgi:hypothetical protein